MDKMTKEEQLYLAAIINANRHQKLHDLGIMIKGPPEGTAPSERRIKSASFENNFKRPGPIEREVKLRQLGKIIRGK
ncbi:MAG: hypothetical protein WBW34_06500 [Nitrososphaeraceae archaeon]